MERQICLDMHEDLTQTQARFQVFIVKSRIEEIISANYLKDVISNLHIVEDFKRKKDKNNTTQDIFELNKELENLKDQLKGYLTPNENQSNTYNKAIVVSKIVNELSENFQKLTNSFFDAEKCKGFVEDGYSPLHQMMKGFRESCQKHFKNSKLKQSDLDQINEVVDSYIKENTNLFIQQSQEQEFYKNVDISYSHLLYLRQQLAHNLEEIIDFIEDKAKNGVEVKNHHKAEDYLRQNGINLKAQRDNIEKRKESLKNIASIKGLKNKENLDEIALQIKADERWIDIIVQIIDNLILLKRDVHDKLQDQLTFPPSFSIPEGKEVEHLLKFIEDINFVIEKAIDNFEDPLDVPQTTINTTEGNTDTKNDDKIVRFSIADNFSTEGDQHQGQDRILKDNKPPAEYRLGKVKQSMTRSMKVVSNFLDYIIKQIRTHQDNEKRYFQISNNYLLVMDRPGRLSFLDLYGFVINLKTTFDSFCTGLIKTIPVQLKFLINLLHTVREKYINYTHEIIVKKYAKENILQIGMIVRKVDDQFDLNQIINFLKEQIEKKYQSNPEQIENQVLLVRDSFLFVEEQLNTMEEILDEIHKAVGQAKSLTSTQSMINDIANEDEMYFWQRFCNQVSDFYTTYEDIKKKKIYIKDESQIDKIFQSKISTLVSTAQGKMAILAKNICDKYIKLIMADYVWFSQTLDQQATLSHHKSQKSLGEKNV